MAYFGTVIENQAPNKKNKKMKKNLMMIAAAALVSVSAVAQKIVVKGSDTVLPLAQKEAESFMKKSSGSSVTVVGGGSGVGIAALLDGTTDIAMSSRSLKMDERMKLQDAGKAFKEITIAHDALAAIVNPANKVSKLTREQLEGIYTGKIKNWKEVGGDDMPIVVYSRETSSGTYEFFKEHVMNRKNYASSVLNMPATGAVIQSVSQTKGAIGYVGLAYVSKDVKDLAVSYDKGKTYTTASVENAKNKSYPIVRPLFFFYPTAKEKMVKPLVDFILSSEGQKIVSDVGYVSLN
jgi:phosphate transport system substrate-binding protein